MILIQLALICIISFGGREGNAQTNIAPEITGQVALSTDQDVPIEILFEHLQVTDPDDVYPNDFTMIVDAGPNYTVSGTTITPDPGYTGVISAGASVNDGEASSPVFDLQITVNAVAAENVVPVISGQLPLSTPEGQPLTINLSDLIVEDPDDAYPTGFTLTLRSGPHYTIDDQNVIPRVGFTGTLSVPVTVNDGEDESERFSLEITVIAQEPVNVKPVITGHVALSTEEDTPIVLELAHLLVTDPDNNYPVGFTMTVSAGTNYSVTNSTVTPSPGFTGALAVPVTVNDGLDESDPFTLSITVIASEPTNVKPVITGQVPLATEEGTPIAIQLTHLSVTDPDDTYPTGFTLAITPGNGYTVTGLTVTPDAGLIGTLAVPVTVNDGEATSDPFNLSISVSASEPENAKPVITGQVALTTEENKPVEVALTHLLVTDPDNLYPDDFTMTISGGENYTVNGANVLPDNGFTGQLSVPVTVDDGEAASDPFNLVITVEPKQIENTKPVIIGQNPISILNSETFTVTLANLFVSDPDDAYPDGFTLKIYPGSNYTINGTTVTPPANFTGTLTVEVSVNDGKDESDVFDLKISVNAPASNVKPVITGQQELTTFRDTPLTLRLTHLIVSDPDDIYPGNFTMEVLKGTNYTVSGNKITPAPSFSGSLSVGVRVNDGTVWSEAFILTITVAEKDELRITGQDEIIIKEDSSLAVLAAYLDVNDPSGHYPAGFTVLVGPGENYVVNGVTITPAPDFAGTIEVPVQVRSAEGTSNSFRMIILVTPVNDPPEFTTFYDDIINYSPGGGIGLSPEAVVSDPDNNELVFAEVFIDLENFIPGKDVLSANSTERIRSVFDPATGILVLLGLASLDEYQNTIRTVQYTYANDTLPPVTRKNIRYRMNDGENFSPVYTKVLEIGESINLDIPNVFSPNDDRSNDTWVISRQSLSDNSTVSIRVFDRRGGIVYESSSLDERWDGRFKGENLPSDTYFYTILINTSSNSITRRGVVTILR